MPIDNIEKLSGHDRIKCVKRKRLPLCFQNYNEGRIYMSTENMSFMDKLMAKVDVIAGPMTRFGQIPFIKAVVNGMVGSIGVTMVGSIFLIIFLLCSDGGLTETALLPFMKPWAGDLALINSLSMGMMAVYIVIAMGAEYAEIKGFNKTTGAVGAFFAFILLNYNAVGKLFVEGVAADAIAKCP